MKKKALLLFALAVALLLTGCGATKIGRINADPTRYRNRTVKVNGTVTNAVGLLGTGGYQVQDDTGRIYVISSTGVPSRGSRVEVTGRVVSGANVLGHSIGTSIREQHHKVKW